MSLIARIRLRSTLIISPSAGSSSACRSCGDTVWPCRMTRPSEVRKIDDAAPWSLSVHSSSTRNFTIVSLLIPLMAADPHEQVVDRNRLGDHGLIDQELHQRLERAPVRLDTVGPE